MPYSNNRPETFTALIKANDLLNTSAVFVPGINEICAGLPCKKPTPTATPTPGTLSMASGSASQPTAIILDGNNHPETYTIPITVNDTTHSGAGWDLTVSMTQFTNGGHTLNTTAVSVTGVNMVCASGTCTNPTNSVSYTLSVPSDGSTTTKFYNADVNTGMGEFSVNSTFQVNIPDTAYAGTYSSVMTISTRVVRNQQSEETISKLTRMCFMQQLPVPRYRLSVHLLLGMLALVFAALLVGTTQISSTHAASGGPSFAMQPATFDPANPLTRAYFILQGKSGTALQNSIVLTNNGVAAGTVNLYAVDATTEQNSGIVYLPQDAPRHDTGAWIKLSISQITLAAGQSKVVPFQIVIPQNAYAGQHVGGIVADTLQHDTATKDQRIQIAVHSRRVVAVEVTLPGAQIEQLQAKGIQIGGSDNYETLNLELSNTGTMLFKAAGTLSVSDKDGKVMQNMKLSLGSFLPQTSIVYPAYVQKKALGVGTYQANLMLKYGHGHVLNYATTFTISAKQVTRIFNKVNNPLQPPLDNGILSLPILIAGGFLVLLLVSFSVFFLTRKFSRVKN